MKTLFYSLLFTTVFFSATGQVNTSEDTIDEYDNVANYQNLDGDLSLEEGAEVYIYTAEERIKSQARLALANQMRITFPTYTELSGPWFKQQNGYYCGPATVKQVLHYINGVSQSQDDYAAELGTTSAGTDMTRIPGVLNSHISGYEYAYDDIGTAATWLNIVRTSLYNNKPAILDINTVGRKPPFPYESEGHFVNVSGYDGVNAKVRITDPYDDEQKRWYSVNDLYGANSAHWRKAIIW